jgi:hypothetical protein
LQNILYNYLISNKSRENSLLEIFHLVVIVFVLILAFVEIEPAIWALCVIFEPGGYALLVEAMLAR